MPLLVSSCTRSSLGRRRTSHFQIQASRQALHRVLQLSPHGTGRIEELLSKAPGLTKQELSLRAKAIIRTTAKEAHLETFLSFVREKYAAAKWAARHLPLDEVLQGFKHLYDMPASQVHAQARFHITKLLTFADYDAHARARQTGWRRSGLCACGCGQEAVHHLGLCGTDEQTVRVAAHHLPDRGPA